MAKKQYDAVVEAVHYAPDGQVEWVRAYLRRFNIFSDRVKLDRETLINNIRSGKKIVVGQRVPQMGANFEVTDDLKVVQRNGKDFLVIGEIQSDQDHLTGVPHI